MKTLTALSALVLLFTTNLAAAHADPACAQCSSLDQMIVKLKNNAPDAIEAAKKKMEDFTFSKDAATAKLEAAAFVRLSVLAIKIDKWGEAADYYSGAAQDHPKLIAEAVKGLSPADQAALAKARRESDRAFKEGNG